MRRAGGGREWHRRLACVGGLTGFQPASSPCHIDGWTLAARYAARMLPQIFRPDDPVLQVGFAPEHKRALEKLVSELPGEVFTAEDSLGWVYQFWQAERKDEVNASGDKITGETLPAVTQLFTEHYMVLFLLHNTIGAWWAARWLSADDADLHRLETEEAVRKAVSPPGYEFSYLRLIREEMPTGARGEKENLRPSAKSADKQYRWKPAAGGFTGWPKSLKDFKLLDPCCGSGHFLVAAFVLLVLLRMRDEKLSAKDACDAVLRENLHGLELDPRCTQIAAFALALTAWKFPNLSAEDLSADDTDFHRLNSNGENNLRKSAKSADALGFRPLPPLNIACSGLGVNARKEDWLALANLPAASKNAAQAGGDTRLRSGLEQLYDLFQKAPELGSLINPRRLAHGDLVTASFAEIHPLLTKALQSEKAKRNDDLKEIGVAAQGMAQAAKLLSEHYQLVITNVPYLLLKKQSEIIKGFSERYADDAKMDLATVFLQRSIDYCARVGATALVTPQNWLFLGSYDAMRVRLLKELTWCCIARLGPKGFQTPMWDFNVLLSILSAGQPAATQDVAVVDVANAGGASEKDLALRSVSVGRVRQAAQLQNPDARFTFDEARGGDLLSRYADCFAGIQNGDAPRFQRLFWEVAERRDLWHFQQATVPGTMFHGGREMIIYFDMDGRHLREEARIRREKLHDSDQRGNQAWGKCGVVVSQMNELAVTLYTGELYDQSCAVILSQNQDHVLPIWVFCSSPEFNKEVRRIDQKLNVTNSTLVKVPFDLIHWQRVAAEKYPNGLPEPDSNAPTQWLFNGRLADSAAPLQVGVARLLGYRWPRQTGQTVSGAAPVPDDGLEKFVDEDGIVCIPSVRGEAPAAERLRALLAAAYLPAECSACAPACNAVGRSHADRSAQAGGKAWNPGKLDELLSAADYAGSNLEDWLRNGFFDQHNKMFHQRPFIWQIWDGRKDGFSALVNYHKLDHKLLEKLTYTYLGEWIKKQQEAVANEESGADLSADGQAGDRLLKAQQLQDKLKLILEGEKPYDIFVRWKALERQPIGWHPGLNDGVRLNIRPFMEADLSAGQAGVLRKRPNIKWGVDRGKNPPGSPWGEERDNDRHLTLEEKRKARGM